jgi:hypothetical protein
MSKLACVAGRKMDAVKAGVRRVRYVVVEDGDDIR